TVTKWRCNNCHCGLCVRGLTQTDHLSHQTDDRSDQFDHSAARANRRAEFRQAASAASVATNFTASAHASRFLRGTSGSPSHHGDTTMKNFAITTLAVVTLSIFAVDARAQGGFFSSLFGLSPRPVSNTSYY